MPKISQPNSQIRLTDVAIVRLKKAGKRFEIACHKGKVLPWRNNTEKDIDEVLQTHTVFTNVSKGLAAKKDELLKAFGKSDQTEVCKEILAKGDLQVSEKERHEATDAQLSAIVSSIASMCLNPETKKAYGAAEIEKALREHHFALKPNKSAKLQTAEALKLLSENMPIQESRMKLRVTFDAKEGGGHRLKDAIAKLAANVENEKWEQKTLHMTLIIEPGNHAPIEELVRKETKGKGHVELLEVIPVAVKERISSESKDSVESDEKKIESDTKKE